MRASISAEHVDQGRGTGLEAGLPDRAEIQTRLAASAIARDDDAGAAFPGGGVIGVDLRAGDNAAFAGLIGADADAGKPAPGVDARAARPIGAAVDLRAP